MRIQKRLIAVLMAALLFICCTALAEIDGRSDHGAFVVEANDKVYTALRENTLYTVSAEDGSMTLLDSGDYLDELVSANGGAYYLRTKDGVTQILRVDEDDTVTTLSEFESGVEVSGLSWYDDVLYCLADNRLYIVDPETGICEILCEEMMTDYAIVNDVIFYTSATDLKTYEQNAPAQTEDEEAESEMLSQSAGTLWNMSILGTNPEKLLDEGVTGLKAYDNYLFFHNLSDNYIMGSGSEMWLEGKLYRYNIETQQTASFGLDYDWGYFPTDMGLVVYTSGDVSLYPLTGGEGVSLMQPETRTAITAAGNDAYVYEYTYSKLTRVPLDGSDPVVISDDSDVLPDAENVGEDDLMLIDEDGDGEEDGTDDAEGDDEISDDESDDDETITSTKKTGSGYIFPNSNSKKLTRKQVLAIDKSKWGYARNEIYARHGYKFKNSKYANYFAKKSWYKPGGFSTGDLNSIEWYNMELIKGLEQEYGLLEETPSKKGEKNPDAKNNYYVLKEASSKKLSKKYLRNKLGSKSKYALARNEILARHGYVFKTAKYKEYFNNQKWYKAGGYSAGKVSNIEWYNIKQLKALENE